MTDNRQLIADSLQKVIDNQHFIQSETRQYTTAIIASAVSALAIIASIIIARMTINKSIDAARQNLDRQLKVQWGSTVQKEWIQNVRNLASELLLQSHMMAIHMKYTESEILEESSKLFLKTYSSLIVFLNKDNPEHNPVFKALDLLAKQVISDDGEINQAQLETASFNFAGAVHKLIADLEG